MDITFEKAIVLKQIIDSIKDLVTDAIIDCTTDGIILQSMDSGHVALCSLYLNNKCKTNISIGVSLVNIGLILKCAKNEDKIILKLKDNSDSCQFIFESPDRKTEFNFKLMNIDSEKYGIPDVEYDCIIQLDSKILKTIISDISTISDTCKISTIEDNIIFSADGQVSSIIIKQKCKCKKQINNISFSVNYLQHFMKATVLSDSVNIYISTEYPLCLEYSIKDVGFIKYYLAPKITDE